MLVPLPFRLGGRAAVQDPARFGRQPQNVRLEAVPQPKLLPQCDLFLTHGGFNSVKESLNAAVPMVVIPITADQPYSAQRCAALGVAEVVGPDHRTADQIRESALKVLTDLRYRDKATEFRAKMTALPQLGSHGRPARVPGFGHPPGERCLVLIGPQAF